ncbi:MAG TPA: ThuA domain-containing protein, partial [Phycisphaerae bacterium]|nr:ThuA domain-containing protein [Phycisphaerae bacterium]
EWNDYRIVAQGFHFTHTINGQKMSECIDEDKEVRREDGLVALQLHAGPPMKVQFRNIRIKKLAAESGKKVQRMKDAREKKIALIAGRQSHGYGGHEHKAGCMLLAKYLGQLPGVECKVYTGGWPKDPKVLEDVDAIVLFSDGGGGNPIIPHLEEVAPLMKKGVGLACLHYAVEVPKGKAGEALLAWTGGYFEPFWSVNPHWKGEFKKFPEHPVTRGVKPFAIDDEWYYHMRFPEGMKNVTPVLTAIPPDSTRERPDGPHSGNPTVRARKGMPEHLGWVIERPDGGRGFGFTGGHWQWNWACDSFRTLVLNGIAWIAKIEIPAGGIPSKTPTWEELEANQDYKQPGNFNKEHWQKLIEEWNK